MLKALLDKAAFHFIFYPAVAFKVLFIGRAVFFTTLVILRPSRTISYATVIRNDLAACAACVYLVYPIAAYLSRFMPGYHSYPAGVAHLPLFIRLPLYFILADFGHYWIHRLTHTRYFWPVHKWHHSPAYMYWLGGVRATLPQQFLVNIPYVLAYPLLEISPEWMPLAIITISTLQNDWMHMNVTWQSKRLQWIFMTPGYHHIHHSADPQHYGTNLGNLFTVWDRLFGTYFDPEAVSTQINFGLDTQENPVRLVLGF